MNPTLDSVSAGGCCSRFSVLNSGFISYDLATNYSHPTVPPPLKLRLRSQLACIEALIGHEGNKSSEAGGGCSSFRQMAGVVVVEEEKTNGRKGQMLFVASELLFVALGNVMVGNEKGRCR